MVDYDIWWHLLLVTPDLSVPVPSRKHWTILSNILLFFVCVCFALRAFSSCQLWSWYTKTCIAIDIFVLSNCIALTLSMTVFKNNLPGEHSCLPISIRDFCLLCCDYFRNGFTCMDYTNVDYTNMDITILKAVILIKVGHFFVMHAYILCTHACL